MHDLEMKPVNLVVYLEQEEDAAVFMGVNLERDEKMGLLKMKQPGLINVVISDLVLENGMDKVKYTPFVSVTLVNNQYVFPVSVSFNYIIVVGMLLGLSVHTRPEIYCAVNCCAIYMLCPNHLHEEDLKQMIWYLKLTQEHGLILNPNRLLLNIDSYPDEDFYGMYGHDNPINTACVKSLTGYVIAFPNCPILWKSKVQTEIYLSTVELKNVGLAHNSI